MGRASGAAIYGLGTGAVLPAHRAYAVVILLARLITKSGIIRLPFFAFHRFAYSTPLGTLLAGNANVSHARRAPWAANTAANRPILRLALGIIDGP